MIFLVSFLKKKKDGIQQKENAYLNSKTALHFTIGVIIRSFSSACSTFLYKIFKLPITLKNCTKKTENVATRNTGFAMERFCSSIFRVVIARIR